MTRAKPGHHVFHILALIRVVDKPLASFQYSLPVIWLREDPWRYFFFERPTKHIHQLTALGNRHHLNLCVVDHLTTTLSQRTQFAKHLIRRQSRVAIPAECLKFCLHNPNLPFGKRVVLRCNGVLDPSTEIQTLFNIHVPVLMRQRIGVRAQGIMDGLDQR